MSIKLYAYQKQNNLNLNMISIMIVGGINKRAPWCYWSVGVGGSLCLEVSWKNGNKCVTGWWCITWRFWRRQQHRGEHIVKFRLHVIVWCLVLCIYKIIWCRRPALKLSDPRKQGSEIYHILKSLIQWILLSFKERQNNDKGKFFYWDKCK